MYKITVAIFLCALALPSHGMENNNGFGEYIISDGRMLQKTDGRSIVGPVSGVKRKRAEVYSERVAFIFHPQEQYQCYTENSKLPYLHVVRCRYFDRETAQLVKRFESFRGIRQCGEPGYRLRLPEADDLYMQLSTGAMLIHKDGKEYRRHVLLPNNLLSPLT
jgi:hypothetical protein